MRVDRTRILLSLLGNVGKEQAIHRQFSWGGTAIRLFLLFLVFLPSSRCGKMAAAEDLYVLGQNGDLLEFGPDGSRSTFATGIGLAIPSGLAFASGSLFVADQGSDAIYKFASDGSRSTFATGLSDPSGLAFDASGNLFVADFSSSNIYRFTPDGSRSTFGYTGDLHGHPTGITFDASGNLFVANYYTSDESKILKFTPSGSRSVFASDVGLPFGLACDANQNLFVTSWYDNNIYKLTPDGNKSFVTHLSQPAGLAVDASGNLFALDNPGTSGTVYRVPASGLQSTFATQVGGYFLAFPSAIAPPPPPPPGGTDIEWVGIDLSGTPGPPPLFEDSTLWLPKVVPGPSDRAIFRRAQFSDVIFAQNEHTDQLIVNNGQTHFDLFGNTYTVNSVVTVGQVSGDNAALTVSSSSFGGTAGQLIASSAVIAASAGSFGSVTVDGVGSLRITGTNGGLYVGGTATQAGGTGTLTIYNGAKVLADSLVKVWQNSTINFVSSPTSPATLTTPSLTIAAGGTADQPSLPGKLSGSGAIYGSNNSNTAVTNSGKFAPSGSYVSINAATAAQVYIQGSYTQTSTGTLSLQVDDRNRPGTLSLFPLVVAGAASFGGTLHVDFTGSTSVVAPGDRFNLIKYNNVTSRFDKFTGTAVPGRDDVFFGLNYVQTALHADAGELQMIALETPRLFNNGSYAGHLTAINAVNGGALTLVTHGWNSEAHQPNGLPDWPDAMAASISRCTSPTQRNVVSFDWAPYASAANGFGTTGGPTDVANRAIDIGDSIAFWVKEQNLNYTSLHLLGHSAGSWLVSGLADRLQDGSLPIQLTLFDAYIPSSGIDRLGTGRPAIGGSTTFNEAIRDTSYWNINSDLLGISPGTLPNFVNIDVTAVDPNRLGLSSIHGWPYVWYQGTISNSVITPLGYNPYDNRSLGFGHAVEKTGVVPSQSGPYAAGRVIIVDDYGTPYILGTISLQSAIQLETTPNVTNGLDHVAFLPDHSATLTTGSPAILTEFVTLTTAANLFSFNYHFLSSADGLLSAYFDGTLLFEADSQYLFDKSLTYASGDIYLSSPADIGTHTLIFRLDPDGTEQATANISNVQFGFADLQPVPEPSSLALTILGLASVVLLARRRVSCLN